MVLLFNVQLWFSLLAQSCLALCDPMDCTTPGSLSIPSSWNLLKLMSIESVMPSTHCILCCEYSGLIFFRIDWFDLLAANVCPLLWLSLHEMFLWSLISSFSHFVVSSISLHWSLRKAFLPLLAIHWNSAFRWVYLYFTPLPFAKYLIKYLII